MSKEKILIINTGGTIGMVNAEPDNPLSPLVPAKTWQEIAGNHPVLEPKILGVETGYYQFDPLLDSSDIRYENWQEMAQVVADNYRDYTGFVILHGTDTMCYTASALSFMFENLAKPVIVTGSQLPMVRPRSDAVQNLVTSIHIAANRTFGGPLIPEVCIFFRDELIRGNRSRKLSASGYSAFSSANYPTLARAGEYIEFNTQFIRRKPDEDQEFYANTLLDTHVMVLELFPGFDPLVLRSIFAKPSADNEQIKALILKTFGAGNAPGNQEFLSAIEFINNQNVIIVDVTQCPEGAVELGLYEASSGLLNRGVISGVDLTLEAAVCKLMFLLGKGWPLEEVKRVMQLNLIGEQSLNIFTIDFDQPQQAGPLFKTGRMVPGDIDFVEISGASIRFHNAKFLKQQDADTSMDVKIFFNHPDADQNTTDQDPHFAGSISRQITNYRAVDLFCNVQAGTKRLLKPGQFASILVAAPADRGISWEKMSFSIYTAATT